MSQPDASLPEPPEVSPAASKSEGTRSGLKLGLRKIGLLVTVYLFSSITLFIAVNLVSKDPVSLRIKNPDPARVEQIRNELGLNDPMPLRYLHYIIDFARGDWGASLISGLPVRVEMAEFLPATLELALAALILGVLLGVTTALAAQWLQWAVFRKLAQGLGALGLTVPIFWLGMMFIVVGSYKLGWFPTGGRFDFARETPEGSGFLLIDTLMAGRFDLFKVALAHLVLPVCCLALYPAALVSGVLQARFEDTRLQALVRALRAKGLAPWQIWLKHVLRLLGAPVITVVGTNFGALLGGAVLTETVFSWPGMGRYLVEAVLNRDLFVVENGLLLVIMLAFVVISLTDLFAFLVNPLARAGRTSEA